MATIQQAPQRSRACKSDEKWNSHKEMIYQIYVEDENTLAATMGHFEDNHGLKAR
jgi:hypothetical protein